MIREDIEFLEKMEALKDFLSGGVGGGCLVLVGQPFDNIKVQLQASGSTKTTMSAAREIYSSSPKGLLNFYRGASPIFLGVAPVFAVCFLAFAQAKGVIKNIAGIQHDNDLSLFLIGVAGSFTALPTTILLAPGERIKIVMQTDSSSGSAIAVAKKIVQSGGIKSLFRGSSMTLVRDGFGSLGYFSTYEGVKRAAGSSGPSKNSSFTVLLAGGLAGVVNWIIALPFDVLKTRIQQSQSSTDTLSLAKTLLQTEGIRGLYRGLFPVLLRAFPANAACFYGMESTKTFLDYMNSN